MRHKGTARLETERLILRRHVIEDAEPMFRNWASDEEVTRFLTWLPHESAEKTAMLLERWIGEYENADYYQWGIELKELGEVIGSISVVHITEAAGCCEIGYCISRKYWGMGIMPEALSAVIRFLFEEVGAEAVSAAHDPKNPNSGRVMQKCGMRYDGLKRHCSHNNTGVCGLAWYSILRSEYFGTEGDIELVTLRERPKFAKEAAIWFSGKFGVPVSAYEESMEECLSSDSPVPNWYMAIKDGRIVGGMGVIENDFHERKDLSPNVCAVYTEEDMRGKRIAGALLKFVCADMKSQGVPTLYLLTDHDSFYERYGWEYLCPVLGDGEETPARMYVHKS